MNPHTLNDFITHIKSVGLPLAAYYFVLMPSLPTKGGPVTENPRTIALLCDSVNMPGVNIMSAEVRVFGEVTDVPFGITYPPLQMEFILDHNFSARNYFEDWSQLVMNRATRAIGYYEDYIRQIDVIAADKNGEIIFGVRLFETWPKTISDTILSSGARDIIRLQVSLAYKYWKRLDPTNEFTTTTDYGTKSVFEELGKSKIFKETLANSNMAVNLPNELQTGVGAEALTQYGPSTAADFVRSGNACSAVLNTSNIIATSVSTGSPVAGFSSTLGGLFGSTGAQMGSFANAIGQLGTAVNTIAGPISAATNALVGVSGTLGSIDALLSSVGINSGLGNIANGLTQSAGKLAVVSQLNNIPGSLTSIGANMGAAGGAISEATRQISGLPGATSSVTGALSNIGALFGTKGSTLGNLGNTF